MYFKVRASSLAKGKVLRSISLPLLCRNGSYNPDLDHPFAHTSPTRKKGCSILLNMTAEFSPSMADSHDRDCFRFVQNAQKNRKAPRLDASKKWNRGRSGNPHSHITRFPPPLSFLMALPLPPSPHLRLTSSLSSSPSLFSPSNSFLRIPSRFRSFLAFLSSNGYLAGSRPPPRKRDKIYRRMDSCLVVPPPDGRRPVAVVKFLGGAFIGAAPELTYSLLMELLANEGFLIVSVPYGVTFDHSTAAREVYERFHSCLDRLVSSGVPESSIAGSELHGLPLYSVGHSNGALLQMLVGSYFPEKILQANAVISFNNKPASQAVPYFEQIGPVARQLMPLVEASPIYSAAQNASGDVWKALVDGARPLMQELDQEIMESLGKFVDQLPSVLGQVNEGTSEFIPSPPENREFIRKSYRVPHTLLVKFSVDAIDESDVLEDILRHRTKSIGGTVEKVTLSGNHLTPCIQDVKWQVGYHYTPADAVAQSLKSLSLNETRVVAQTIADWFKRLDN